MQKYSKVFQIIHNLNAFGDSLSCCCMNGCMESDELRECGRGPHGTLVCCSDGEIYGITQRLIRHAMEEENA